MGSTLSSVRVPSHDMVCLKFSFESFDGVILVTSNGKNPGALPWEFSVRVRVRIPSYNDNIWARSPLYQFTGWYMLLVTHSSTVRPGNELRSRYLNEQD